MEATEESIRSCISSIHPVANKPIGCLSSSATLTNPYNLFRASSNATCVIEESMSSGWMVISFAVASSLTNYDQYLDDTNIKMAWQRLVVASQKVVAIDHVLT